MRALVAALLFACAAFPAHAQPRSASLAGHWNFETEVATERGCVIRGAAVLTPQDARGRYDVQLSAHETCRSGDQWRATERCTATQTGRAVRVDCTLLTAEPGNYAADNFTLDVRGADLMVGVLLSTWNARAEWRRAAPALVS